MDKKESIKKFKEYILNFDIEDSAIRLKYYHSIRVMYISIFIASSLKLNKSDIEVSSYIGLLHDYGRFMQWKDFHTYNDLISIDHADLGVKLLFDNNDISKYKIDKKYYNFIYNAIKYHNKFEIKDSLNKKEKQFALIIRDADKLDILNIICGRKYSFIKKDKISKKVKNDFFKRITLDRRDTTNDFEKYLLHLAMIFGLNYKCSYLYLKRGNILERIYKNLEKREKYKKYFDCLNNYIDERIEEYDRY